jgi:hypothetical protein
MLRSEHTGRSQQGDEVVRGGLLILLVSALVAACGGSNSSAAPSAPAAVPLSAGPHTTTAFEPAVSFTLPEGWEKPLDTDLMVTLRPAGSEVDTVNLFRDVRAASQAADCARGAEPGVGSTSSELAAWIKGLPGLEVSNPTLASLGGLRGVSLDVAIRDDWTASCPFANGNRTVPLITGPNDSSYHWVTYGDEKARLYILDVPGGGTVTVMVDTVFSDQFADLVAAAAPIVRSMEFGTP